MPQSSSSDISTSIAFLVLVVMFIILILIRISWFDIGSFIIYYFIPTLKMVRDINNQSKCRKWVFYYAGIVFLTIFYFVFCNSVSHSYLAFFLSFPLTFRDGALVAFFAKVFLEPLYTGLTKSNHFKHLSKSITNFLHSLSKSMKKVFPFF